MKPKACIVEFAFVDRIFFFEESFKLVIVLKRLQKSWNFLTPSTLPAK